MRANVISMQTKRGSEKKEKKGKKGKSERNGKEDRNPATQLQEIVIPLCPSVEWT